MNPQIQFALAGPWLTAAQDNHCKLVVMAPESQRAVLMEGGIHPTVTGRERQHNPELRWELDILFDVAG